MNTRTATAQISLRDVLLSCGILAAAVYIAGDMAAGMLYPDYSFVDQYVSELFAIGAPTSRLVIWMFTLSSVLLTAFALGIWRSAGDSRSLRFMALAILASALIGLVLWNFFPMHMRGAGRTFTDTMHLVLATNPFVLLSLLFGVAAFRNWFRVFTLATILVLLVPAVFAFWYAPQIDTGQATPGLGLGERIAQYAYQLWQVTLAGILVHTPSGNENREFVVLRRRY